MGSYSENRLGPILVKISYIFCAEYERSLRMTEIDFISALGGVFGLFLGFSLISFVEIIYWFCVVLIRRLIWGKCNMF